jgi:hypothetical protein
VQPRQEAYVRKAVMSSCDAPTDLTDLVNRQDRDYCIIWLVNYLGN